MTKTHWRRFNIEAKIFTNSFVSLISDDLKLSNLLSSNEIKDNQYALSLASFLHKAISTMF